ncbi:MAG TPA: molybdenum cofactor biosynthesis protein MoaE [Candidatus Nanopelagicales bacterium]|nr:molybdenum cofactor biosynthesis protein MoaE [Candidatus Nanopelagicales bacterium]
MTSARPPATPHANNDGARVRIVEITATALSVERMERAVADPRAGGTALFVGTVRDHDGGRSVRELSYQAHPSATRVMREVAASVAAGEHVVAVAAAHRVGLLEIGDLAVVVAVSCAHRGDAFEAGRALIDRIKAEVPIWKLQQFTDGDEEWVACHEQVPATAARPRTLDP